MKTGWGLVAGSLLWTSVAVAGEVFVPGLSSDRGIPVESFRERQYRHVVEQRFDFSCGSAAVATLLTYHYRDETSEADVFTAMYEQGNQAKIRDQGFSMLDMKNYLLDRGYQADGYRLEFDKVSTLGVPIIALLNTDGYMHFVVVKGIENDQVLVGDSALGRKIYSRAEFEEKWNGIAFLVRNRADISRQHFNLDEDWLVTHRYPIHQPLDRGSIAPLVLNFPLPRDF